MLDEPSQRVCNVCEVSKKTLRTLLPYLGRIYFGFQKVTTNIVSRFSTILKKLSIPPEQTLESRM